MSINKNQIKDWLKENWFKFLIAFSIFYYFVVFATQNEYRKDVAIHKQNQVVADNEYWGNLKIKTQGIIDDVSGVRAGAEDSIDRTRKWLNSVYPLMTDPSYSKIVPLIDASEHYIATEKKFIDSLDRAVSVKYRKISTIEQRNQLALDKIILEESEADAEVSYWITQTQKELEQIEVLKSESIKSL